MTGYWQYEVVEITTTCTSWLGAVEYLLPSDATVDIYTPDGQYVGQFDFEGGVPRRFDFYYNYPCNELALSRAEWVEHQDPGDGEGSGGGSGGGGDDGPQPPSSGPEPEEINLDFEGEDLVVVGDTINCTLQQENEAAGEYCAANRLSAMPNEYLQRLVEANERMRSKGGLCAEKAAIVDSILARDAIRTSTTFTYSGWSPIGLRGMGGISIHTNYFTRWYNASKAGRYGTQLLTLQFVLSHEVDHLMGHKAHIDADELLTANTLECSDLTPGQA